jgi:hypothetical protein
MYNKKPVYENIVCYLKQSRLLFPAHAVRKICGSHIKQACLFAEHLREISVVYANAHSGACQLCSGLYFLCEKIVCFIKQACLIAIGGGLTIAFNGLALLNKK